MSLSKLAAVSCALFALLLLFLVQSPGDGGWSLYADQLLNGSILYRDIKFNQQPLFLLFAMIGANILPDTYFAQKSFYSFVPLLYVYSIYKISEFCKPSSLRPLLILAVFFTAIHFEAYRFDDYHAFCGALILYSLYLSLLLLNGRLSLFAYSFMQCLLISIVMFTRLNDGFALLIFYIAVIYTQEGLGLSFVKRMIGLLIFLILFLALLLTYLGVSFAEWSNMTIFAAAKIKGGDAGLFVSLYKILNNSIQFIYKGWSSIASLYMLASVVLLFGLERTTPASYRNTFAVLVSIFFIYIYQVSHAANVVYAAIPYAFVFSALVLLCLFGKWLFSGFDASQIIRGNVLLLLLPFLLFLSGSVSSAGSFGDSYYQLALMLLLLVAVDFKVISRNLRSDVLVIFIFVFYSIIALNSFWYRVTNPYSWHAYHAPQFGPAYEYSLDEKGGARFIPKELTALVEPVCEMIGSDRTLLSVPFSYANYHCGLKPWGGYVQTFFDTSSREVIDELIEAINSSPPDYIFYQRQVANLSAHEAIFNSGKELPHRNLDRLIMKNITLKKWKVVYSSGLYPPSEWLLIKTSSKND